MKYYASSRGRQQPQRLPLFIGLLVMLAVGLAGCGASSSGLSGPVLAAKVNGSGIALSNYQSMMTFAVRSEAGTSTSWQSPSGRQTQAGLQKPALDFLINFELSRQQAAACGVKVTQQDIATQRKQLESAAKSVLADPTNSEWPTFHALMTTPHILDFYSEQQAYEVALTKVLNLPTAHISYIMVPSKKQAESILQQVEQGANFATVGQQVQSAAGSSASYSDLGTQYVGEFLGQYDYAVFAHAEPTKAGCYNNLRLNKNPPKYQIFALTGQNAGQYLVVETTAVANAPLAALNDAQTEGSIFQAWIIEIVRLPGHSNVEKYPLPVTTDQPSSGS
jgi:hypothetical protein